MKLRKGDRVIVLSGKDKGKEGTITRVIPEKSRVLVEGVNMVKKHQKAGQQTQGRQVRQGGIIDREMPVHISNVALVSPGDGKSTKVGFKIAEDGTKVRICRRTGSEV